MLTLKKCVVKDDLRQIETFYEASHSTPGRNGTRLTIDLIVTSGQGVASVTADMGVCKAKTQEEALDKFASWCERTAIALRHRGVPVCAAAEYPDFIRPIEPDEEPTAD